MSAVINNKVILSIQNTDGLRWLKPEEIVVPLNDDAIKHILSLCDAFWAYDYMYEGNPKKPHALLTSGKHSDGFVDVLRALRFTNLCRIFANQMVDKLNQFLLEQGHQDKKIAWVIGSDHAGATLSHTVATILNVQHDFTEKGPDKTQLWSRFPIGPDELVLQVEELIRTTSTLEAVRRGIRQGNDPNRVQFMPCVMTLVHRSPIYTFEDAPILHLLHLDIQVWDDKEHCPLCAAGSEALRPKHDWLKLTGKN